MHDLAWILNLRSDSLTIFFKFFQVFASESFYLVFISIGYWCWNKKLFRDLAILLCISTLINFTLKLVFQIPRPAIEHLAVAESYSFPSGDIQVVASIWLTLAWHFKNVLLWGWSLLLILFVGLSRIYLGVHYPLDVIAGAFIGAFIPYLYFYCKNSSFLLTLLKNHFFLVLSGIVLLLIYPLILLLREPHILSISTLGALSGIILGIIVDRKNKETPHLDSWKFRLFSGVLGLSTLYALRAGLSYYWKIDPQWSYLFFIYVVIGFHVIFVVPRLNNRCLTPMAHRIQG